MAASESYSVGDILGSIGGGGSEEKGGAAELFAQPSAKFDSAELRARFVEEGTVKRKNEENEKSKSKKHRTETEERKRSREQRNEEEEEKSQPIEIDEELKSRTIFVGNLPLTVKTKKIKRYFAEFGSVHSVRLRSLPTEGAKVEQSGSDPSLLKRIGAYKKNFSETAAQTANAYLVFETKDAADRALEANGRVFMDRHLRVDATHKQSNDHLRTAFVGNLPHDTDEEALRSHFAQRLPGGDSSVSAIRIIRNSMTRIGIGIAYITLADPGLLPSALQLDGIPFSSNQASSSASARQLRVRPCAKHTKRTKEIDPKKPKKKLNSSLKGAARRVLAKQEAIDKSSHKKRKTTTATTPTSNSLPSWMGRRVEDTKGNTSKSGSKKASSPSSMSASSSAKRKKKQQQRRK